MPKFALYLHLKLKPCPYKLLSRSKKVASDVLGFLVSPYAQRFLCKPDDGSEVVILT